MLILQFPEGFVHENKTQQFFSHHKIRSYLITSKKDSNNFIVLEILSNLSVGLK